MILTCPSCGTRYQTDRSRFMPPGANVHCAKCMHVWFHGLNEGDVETEPDPVMPAPPPEPEPEEISDYEPATVTQIVPERLTPSARPTRTIAPRRERKPSSLLIANFAGWLGLGAFVALICWAAIGYRQTIAELWPQSASLYAALHMPVNVRGLALENVTYTQEFEDGQPILSVSGKVVNVTTREVPVPSIRASLSDLGRHELYHWIFDIGVKTMKPGETSAFVTRLASPPADARTVDLRFAQAGDLP